MMRKKRKRYRSISKSSESDKKQNAVDGKEYTRGQYNDKMMLGSKAPNNDANGLFRATHSHNPTRYSHIMVLTPHFYAHIGAGLKVILPPVCKHTWFQTF